MKKKKIFLAISVILAIFAMQGCTKEGNETYTEYNSFTVPTLSAPTNAALIKVTGTTVELKWVSADLDLDPVKCDVYFGTSSSPKLYKADHNSLTLSVPVAEGSTYYWRIVMKDAHGVMTKGPTWSFSVAVNYDINNFVGLFDCNEPGYGHYNCTFTKISATTVHNDNFWDSGWGVNYVLDDYGNVNITPISYTSGGVTYDITGTGKFNNTAKSFYVDYLVKNHATGATVDSNKHTFVKK